jgi:hypothetical protein
VSWVHEPFPGMVPYARARARARERTQLIQLPQVRSQLGPLWARLDIQLSWMEAR